MFQNEYVDSFTGVFPVVFTPQETIGKNRKTCHVHNKNAHINYHGCLYVRKRNNYIFRFAHKP